LILLAYCSSGKGHQAEVIMADHDTRRLATFGIDHISAVNRHGIAVGVVIECSRGRPVGVIIGVSHKMPRGNPPEQPNFVSDPSVVRKVFVALVRGCHWINQKRVPTNAGSNPRGPL